MKWKGRRKSVNVEDRRGRGRGRAGRLLGGGAGGVIVLLLVMFLGGNPASFLGGSNMNLTSTVPYEESAREQELEEFVSVVLADTENVWTHIFEEHGLTYEHPQLVLYNDIVQSACGTQSSAVGPFYCPGDESLYIDLSFFEELRDRFDAPGDFAIAYVIAHEVGHHVQTLLGTSQQMNALRTNVSKSEYNQYSVRLELQADYYAGVWAYYMHEAGFLYAGDFDEAIDAANAIGDDRLQMQAQGYVVPDSFTHGTSEQRISWFKRGFDLGTLEDGDTFSVHGSEL